MKRNNNFKIVKCIHCGGDWHASDDCLRAVCGDCFPIHNPGHFPTAHTGSLFGNDPATDAKQRPGFQIPMTNDQREPMARTPLSAIA